MKLLLEKIACCLLLISLPSKSVDISSRDIVRTVLGSVVLVGAWESLKNADNAWEKANAFPAMAEEQVLKAGARAKVGRVSRVVAKWRQKILNVPEPTEQQREQQLANDNAKIFMRRFGPFIAWTATTILLTIGGVKLIGKALL